MPTPCWRYLGMRTSSNHSRDQMLCLMNVWCGLSGSTDHIGTCLICWCALKWDADPDSGTILVPEVSVPAVCPCIVTRAPTKVVVCDVGILGKIINSDIPCGLSG